MFNSGFFSRFEVNDEVKAKIKEDDAELLEFGYQWLRYALFGEQTMQVFAEAKDTAMAKFEARKKKAEERDAARKRAAEDK